MRYPASEKLEIIRLVEQSHLPAKRSLDMLGIPRCPLMTQSGHRRTLQFSCDALDGAGSLYPPD